MYHAERRGLLILMDFVAVSAALLFSLALRPEYQLDPQLIFKHPHWFLILMAIWFPLAYAFDCYGPKIVGRFSETAKARIKTGLIASLIYLLIPFLTPALPPSRLLFLSLPLFLVGLTIAVGPRSERPEFVEGTGAGDSVFYRVRHAVRPGMAGRKILLDCDNKMDNHLRFWNDQKENG